MTDTTRWAQHSPYSDPGRFGSLVDALPTDAAALGAAVRNLIVHYRGEGLEIAPERRGEIDCRWVARTLEVDQARHPFALALPRELADRVAGCCRDHTLLAVSALRQHGIPARSRVGFADYFMPDYFNDHVIVEWWNGARWQRFDPELEVGSRGFDVTDIQPGEHFHTAAEVWRAIRSGAADPGQYGIFPGAPIGGMPFTFNYVIRELAHREGSELLLWDCWGGMVDELTAGIEVDAAAFVDGIAELLVAADDGSEPGEAALLAAFEADDRLNPRGRVTQESPYGLPAVEVALR